MGVESSVNPQEACQHIRWIVDSAGRNQKCKQCGVEKAVPTSQPKPYNNFYSSKEKPAYEKRPKAVTGNQLAALNYLKGKINGLNDHQVAEMLGFSSSTQVHKIRDNFFDANGVDGETVSRKVHRAIARFVDTKVIPFEAIAHLPDTQPVLTDDQKRIRDQFASGLNPREIAETMQIPFWQMRENCDLILKETGVDNSFALAAWMARERVRERQTKTSPTTQ